MALSCAPNLASGLHRLSRFKALLGPVRRRVINGDCALVLADQSADPLVETPATMGALQVVSSVETLRCVLAHPLRPLAVTLEADWADRHAPGAQPGVLPDVRVTTSLPQAVIGAPPARLVNAGHSRAQRPRRRRRIPAPHCALRGHSD
jgi:hypothetical protein